MPPAELERLLRSKAVLLPGVKVSLDVEQADGSVSSKTWSFYPTGLASYLTELAGNKSGCPALRRRNTPTPTTDFITGEGAAWSDRLALLDAVASGSDIESDPTVTGGTMNPARAPESSGRQVLH
ncbi:MAG: hypothetical protein IPN05_20345 [Sulfuritalea sp.]|nr:hypothetical protein [Sulfuritalea sp.]